MSGYIGNIPTPQATQTRDTFTATAGQTSFATSGYTPSFLDVFLNGVHLVNGTDYTATNGSDVVLTSGAAAGDVLEVVAYSTFEPADVTASSGFTVTGNLSVDGGTIKLDGNYPVGTGNVALGDAALDDGSLSGPYNTAVGNLALTSNTSGSNNTGIGDQALEFNTTGQANSSLGKQSLNSNTSGSYNTALGQVALFNNTTASNNTAVGYQAGYSNTTGSYNTAIGQTALYSNTTAMNNTAIGFRGLYSNTTGTLNSAISHEALYSNTTGNYNTAVGAQALVNNTTASKNTALGYQAGYINTTGYENVFVGYQSGYNNTGYANNYIGYGAGVFMTSGNANTILGKFSGNQGGLDIRTSSNNIVLSDGDGNPRVWINASNDFYTGPTNTTAGFINYNSSGGQDFYRATSNTGFGIGHWFSDVGGTRSFKAYVDASGNFNTSSDYRIKENVADVTGATDRIKALRPVSYNQIGSDQHQEGFIAHEVQQVVPHVVTGEKDQVKSDGSIFVQTVNYSGLIATLTAALKESITRIEQLEAEVAELKGP